MKKLIFRFALFLVAAALIWGGWRFVRQFEQKALPVPTATVRRGDVTIRSFTRGELRAVRSAMLVAPNLFGTVQVTRLAPLGALAREKDLIVEFDDSEVRSRLDEKQLEIEQLDEQLKKSQAELEIRNNQDQVDLLRARYAVRRAELEVKRNELLSTIDATRNKLNLDEAQRRLKQLESDIQSRLEQSKAELAVLREKKNKALLELQRERQRLGQVKLLAPMSGLVAIRQSRPMGGFFRGMQLPDIREGDQVYPGTPVADVLDLSELEVAAKVGELDRANLHESQEATIRLDAVPQKTFHGKIKTLSGTASANIWSGDVAKKFDVLFGIDMKELLSGLGAGPDQIRQVLETAAKNRTKPATPALWGGASEPPGSGPAQPGAEPRPEGAVRQGGRARAGGQQAQGAPSADQQQKIREVVQKFLAGRDPQTLTPEDQQKMGEQIRAATGGNRGSRPQVSPQAAFAKPGGPPPGPGMPPGFGMGGTPRFSEKDLENADLPPAPEEGNQLEVLLRPGLLADIEIIVERIPNALHIPAQAVFEKDGKPVVYVKTGSQFDARPIKPLKRSESVMVIAEGLRPGEQVALTDPNKKPGGGKKGSGEGRKGGGAAGPGAPAGGAGGSR